MSRSQPTTTNPAKRFFQWSGSKGVVNYYDKEKSENVEVKLPIDFIVLDELSTITGWSEKDGGYWSNEVRNISTDEITVRSKQGVEQTGTYANLGDIKAKGAKYAKSVYIACYLEGELTICNFKASGAALTAWIEFSNKVGRLDQLNGKVSLVGSEEATKGATKYQVPIFEVVESTKEEEDTAFDLDVELQKYLSQYLVKSEELVVEDVSIEAEQEATENNQSGYQKAKEAAAKLKKDNTIEIEDIDTDAPIDLSDIPF